MARSLVWAIDALVLTTLLAWCHAFMTPLSIPHISKAWELRHNLMSPAMRKLPASATGTLPSARRSQRLVLKKMSSTAGANVGVPDSSDPAWKGTEHLDRQLPVRIDGEWFDLSRWRQAHPAGSHWIDLYKNQDATEVLHGFHSPEGMRMVKRLPKARGPAPELPPPSDATENFRKWRAQLVKDGWFERDWRAEAFNLGSWACWFTLGIVLAHFPSLPMQALAAGVLGVAFCVSGWLGHDYPHGTDRWSNFMRPFGCFCEGLSVRWWSEKHNLHHARTNKVQVDQDIATDPLLYLWAPDPANDVPWRRWQHRYWPVAFSLVFVLWRLDSLVVAVQQREWYEVFGMVCHYLFMLSFVPPATFLGAVLLSGFMAAVITTATHQGEEFFFDGSPPDWVEAQFRSTRDARCTNAFSEWVWGGMQYQLEHHLFPTMPRYRYPALQPLVAKFGADNGLSFRITDEWALIRDNVQLYKDVAELPAVPGAQPTRPAEPRSTGTDLLSLVESSKRS